MLADNAQDINAVMPMQNLLDYSDNYLKISESFFNITNTGSNNDGAIFDFADNNTEQH